MPVIESKKLPMELIAHLSHRDYCLEEVKIANGTGNPIVLNEIVGLPLNASNQVVTAANANTVVKVVFAFAKNPTNALVNPITIAAGQSSAMSFLAIVRGPAIIVRQSIADKDLADAAYNKTTIETALKALHPSVLVRDTPLIQTVEA